MNPAIAPAIVAARVRLNDNPAAKPAAGANNVFTEAVRNTEKIFQNIFSSNRHSLRKHSPRWINIWASVEMTVI